MESRYDIVVVGGGPGGSTLSTLLSQAGYKVALLEKETFPRFKIGESLLPFSMDVLKKTGVYEKLKPKYIEKLGAQFISFEEQERIYFNFADGLDSEHPSAFQVPRDQFDLDLLNHAREQGVDVIQPCYAQSFRELDNSVLLATSQGSCEAKFLVDASGQNSFVASQLGLRKVNSDFSNNVAMFCHYEGVSRELGSKSGDIIIGILPERTWSWIIPFKDGRTSVGIVFSKTGRDIKSLSEKSIRDALANFKSHKNQFAQMKPVGNFQVAANFSRYSEQLFGNRWLLLGDAASFLDPVFSSGVHLALSTADFASEALVTALSQNGDLNTSLLGQIYSDKVRLGINRFSSLLKFFYGTQFFKIMGKAQHREATMRSFTSLVGGDMWNEKNVMLRTNALENYYDSSTHLRV